jgi:hypothetical protein
LERIDGHRFSIPTPLFPPLKHLEGFVSDFENGPNGNLRQIDAGFEVLMGER